MRIGELARRAGVPVPTIRFYEKQGLVSVAPRQPNGYRQFREAAVDQLRFIVGCRNLGIPLAAVKKMIPRLQHQNEGCAAISQLIDHQLEQVRERISGLRELEVQLQRLQHACGDGRSISECGILRELGSHKRLGDNRVTGCGNGHV